MTPRAKSASKAAAESRTSSLKQSLNAPAYPQPPNWPALLPLIPTSDLTLVPLLPDHILTIPRFWTAALCKTYVTFLRTLPLVTTPGKPKRGDAVRVNDRYQVDDAEFAEQLWSRTALKELIEQTVIDGAKHPGRGGGESRGGRDAAQGRHPRRGPTRGAAQA